MNHREQERRQALALELSDIAVRQEAVLGLGVSLSNLVEDEDGRKLLTSLVEADTKNRGIIENMVIQFGHPSSPKSSTLELVDVSRQLLNDERASTFEKLLMYTTLKHTQLMCGIVAHKALQRSLPDLKLVSTLLYAVNHTHSQQEAKLKNYLESFGVREITGQTTDLGLIGKFKDAIANAASMVASPFAKPADETEITTLLHADHVKAIRLFREIEQAPSASEASDLFLQLYFDLYTHTIAEEVALYGAVYSIDGVGEIVEQAYDDHSDIKDMLEICRSLKPDSREFQFQMSELRKIVDEHISREENEIFTRIRHLANRELLLMMASEFVETKRQLQDEFMPTSVFGHVG